VGIASLCQELLGLIGIVLVAWQIGSGRPNQRRQRTGDSPGLTAVDEINNRFYIEGVVESLADQGVVKGLFLAVKADIARGKRLVFVQNNAWGTRQAQLINGRDVVGNVNAAGF